MLIHHKCELALAAWLEANRGERLPGVTIVPAHTNSQPKLPILAVCCMRARPHQDFEGCGRQYPQLIPVALHFTANAHDGAHAATVGAWIGQLDELLAGDNYAALITALNPPASGPDGRPQKEFYVYAIHPAEDGGEFDMENFDEMLALEMVVQNGDPST